MDSTSRRFEVLKELSDNGIYAGIILLPILPFINDSEENIKNIIKKAHECNAKFVLNYFLGVTLRGNQKNYFYKCLEQIFPKDKLIEKYEKIRSRDENYISLKNSNLLKVFKEECEKYNILYKMEDIIKAYKSPYEIEQIKLF